MSASAQPILVVGSGPAGLIMALSLAHNGVPVRIIEKQTHYPLGYRGSGIQPRTMELHHFLGVLSDIVKEGRTSLITRYYALPPNGTQVIKDHSMVSEDNPVTPSCPYMQARKLDQSTQEGILRKHLQERFNTVVELGTALESFEQFDDHVVAHLIKSDGSKEQAKVTYLVGADGARGVVRKQLGLKFEGESPVGHMLVGDIRLEGLDYEPWHTWGDASTKMVKIIHTGNEDIFNFLIVDSSVELADVHADRDWAIERFYQITGRTDIKFGDLIFASIWKPNMRMVTEFGKGRVFITGDAAHVHSPTGGQGMNSSEQDSFNLGWKLALCYHNLSPPSLLTSYTPERLPIILTMLRATSKLFRQTVSPNLNIPGENQALNTDAWKRGGALYMLGINCRGSPITLDERHEEIDLEKNDFYDSTRDTLVCAGDRAPDAPGLVVVRGESSRQEEEISLFGGVFGYTYHTVLLYHADAKLVEDVTDVRKSYNKAGIRSVLVVSEDVPGETADGVDLVVKDVKGYAHGHYNVDKNNKEPTVVIVRPDGTIGAVVVSGAEGVRRYFAKILL